MVEDAIFDIHVYQPSESDVLEEFSSGQRGEDDDVTAAGVHELPNRGFEGLWDTSVSFLTVFSASLTSRTINRLVYPDDIKPKLLNYIYATLVLSDADVDCESSFSSLCLFFILSCWNHPSQLISYPGTGMLDQCD